jgi:hypothetical protein
MTNVKENRVGIKRPWISSHRRLSSSRARVADTTRTTTETTAERSAGSMPAIWNGAVYLVDLYVQLLLLVPRFM